MCSVYFTGRERSQRVREKGGKREGSEGEGNVSVVNVFGLVYREGKGDEKRKGKRVREGGGRVRVLGLV